MQKKAPSWRLFCCQILGASTLLLFAASWLNPNHYPPWVVFENEAVAFAGVLVAALSLLVRRQSFTLTLPYITCLLLTLLVVLVQYGTGMISWQFIGLGVLYLAALALSVVIGYGVQQDDQVHAEHFEKTVLTALTLATLISSLVVLVQWLHIEDHYSLLVARHDGVRPYGNLGQPNNQGTLLVVGVLCVEMLLRKQAIGTAIAGTCMLVLLPAVAATGSRTAMLSALIAAAYLLWVGRGRHGVFTALWLFALMVCVVLVPKLGIVNGPDAARMSVDLSNSPRLQIYSQLLWAISESPWVGYGWMQTALAQSTAAAKVFGGVETDYAHNILIDIVVWFGIPLGTLLTLWLSCALISNWRKSQAHYKIAYVLLVPFGVHSLLEFPFAYAFFLFPAGMLLGYFGGHAAANAGTSRTSIRIGWKSVAPLFIFTVALSVVVWADYTELAEDFRVLRFENKKMGAVPDGFQQSSPFVLKDQRFMMDMLRYKPRADENGEKIEKIRHYVLRNHYPGAHIKLISLLIQEQRVDDATGEIRRFNNLYGEAIAKWGMSTLSAAYCEDAATLNRNLKICSLLLEPT